MWTASYIGGSLVGCTGRVCGRLAALGFLLAVSYGGMCTVSVGYHHEHCHGSFHTEGCHHFHSTAAPSAAASSEPALLLGSYERIRSIDDYGEAILVVRVDDGPSLPVRRIGSDALRHGFALALVRSNPDLFAADPAGELAPRGMYEARGGFVATWVRELESPPESPESNGGEAVEVPGYRLQLVFDAKGRLVEIDRRDGLTGFAADWLR